MAIEQLYVTAEDYVAADDRLIWAAMLPQGNGPLGRGSGVRTAKDLILTMTTERLGDISPGIAAIPLGSRHYMLSNDSPIAMNFAAPPAVGQARIDTVVAQVYDSDVSGVTAPARIVPVTGTPATNPSPPALVAGQMRLWDVRYTGGIAAPTLTDRRVVTTSDERKGFSTLLTNGWVSAAANVWQDVQTVALGTGAWLVIAKGAMYPAAAAGSCAWRLRLDHGSSIEDQVTTWANTNQLTSFALAHRVVAQVDTMLRLQAMRTGTNYQPTYSDCRLVVIPVVTDPGETARSDPIAMTIPDSVPRGIVGYHVGLPGQKVISSAGGYPVTMQVPTVPDRCYRVSAQAMLTPDTGSTFPAALTNYDIESTGTGDANSSIHDPRPLTDATGVLGFAGFHYFVAKAASTQVRIYAKTGSGTLRLWAGGGYTKMYVEDVGKRAAALVPTTEAPGWDSVTEP